MNSLSRDEKESIFEFYFHCGGDEQISKTQNLIANNPEAAQLYDRLKMALDPLDSFEVDGCPESLVDSTVERLKVAASAGQARLEKLLVTEQERSVSVKNYFWGNFSRRLATAAVFMIVGSALLFSWNVRSNYARQQQCQARLGRVGQAMSSYSADYDGKLPLAAATAGMPWWKTGNRNQSKDGQSNTRRLWMLAKEGYVKPCDFVCPGNKCSKAIQLGPTKIRVYYDAFSFKYYYY